MFTTMLLAATLAQATPLSMSDFVNQLPKYRTEVRHSAAAMAQDLDAEQFLSDPRQEKVILSAMLCEAQQRKVDVEDFIVKMGLTKSLARASLRADKDVQSARESLQIMNVDGGKPFPCGHREVQKIVECLGATAPAWCQVNTYVEAEVLAAEKISNAGKAQHTSSTTDADTDEKHTFELYLPVRP